MPTERLTNLNVVGKALSDPNRVRALMALRGSELCVCRLIELLGLAPSTVSKHMSILKQAGLVESRKDRQWVYYRFVEETKDKCPAALPEMIVEYLKTDDEIRSDDNTLEEIRNRHQKNVCQ